MKPKVILASASPRRVELLTRMGINLEQIPADIEEKVRDGETPSAYVARNAKEKAVAVGTTQGPCMVIGADTIVELDGQILEKPADDAHAKQMLRSLSDKRHYVRTGIAIGKYDGSVSQWFEKVVTTEVLFRPLSEREIDAYVATGEPMDKAGGYGIQGIGLTLVASINGCYSNVVGLSIPAVYEGLIQFDYFR